MKKTKRLLSWFTILLFALTLGLAGCEGDDGDDGPRGDTGPIGPPGPPGTQVAADIITIPAEITNVSVGGGQPTITFTVSEENGSPITTLTTDEVRFIIAKLMPAQGAEPANWQSYTNRTQEGGAVGPGGSPVLASAVQATTENNGTLTHLGNGEYTYTFATDITNVTSPVAVAYEPDLTHRAAIQIEVEEEGAPVKLANPTTLFVPSGGTPVQPQVALTQKCNECHDLLVAHGGRFEVDYCVTCHNAGSEAVQQATNNTYNLDPQSGNTIDLPIMVHKIHMGRELPSVAEGDGEYAIWGFRDTKHDYSDLGYPQDIRHCTKCHEGDTTAAEDEETAPQGDNWKQWPTIVNCTSCHDDIIINAQLQNISDPAPTFMRNHSGGVGLTDDSCAGCHPPATGGAAGANVTDSHTIPALAQSANFQYNILNTSFDAGTGGLTVTFSVTNPRTEEAYDILQNPAFTTTDTGVSRLFMDFAWPATEFDNAGSGEDAAQPLDLDLLADGNVTDNGDGTYTTTPIIIPEGVDSVGVALEGHPAAEGETAGTFNVRVPVTNAFTTVSLTDAAAPTRREVVSIDKCNVCHNTLSLHGNNRTNVIEVCVMCHNPNATDIEVRPANPDDAVDDLAEVPIDFKTMIHAIHANEIREDGIVVYGFGNNPHDFGLDSETGEAVRYPGILDNCRKCHVDESYQLPLEDIVLATTTTTGTDLLPTDDVNTTPTAAVCSSCHDSQAAQNHMIQNGAEFDITGNAMAADSMEACVICHGPGRNDGLEEVHNIFDVSVPEPEPVLGPVPDAPSGDGGDGEEPTPTEPDGAALFASNCQTCHEAGNLTTDTAEGIITEITVGPHGGGTDFGLSEAENQALAEYIIAQNQPAPAPDGAALFTSNCQSCHVAANLTTGTVEGIITEITVGPHGGGTDFGLSEAENQALAEYIIAQ